MVRPYSVNFVFIASMLCLYPSNSHQRNHVESGGVVKKFSKHILVIDDQELNFELVKDILEDSICMLEHCADPREGLRTLMFSRPDLILLDVDMPEMNGYEVLKQIRSMQGTYKLPVIMFTANADREMVEKLLSLGVHDYIVKPFEAKDLILKLSRFFKRGLF